MEELQNFNFTHLYEKLKMSDNDFDAWLEELGLLHAKKTCKQCGGRTTLKVENRHCRYTAWRCTTKNCRVSSGYLCGTFFERRHLTTKQVFELAYYWAQQFGTIKEIGFQTKISQSAIIGMFDKFRDVCVKYLEENPIKIEEGIIDRKPDNRRRDNYKYQQELIWRTQFGDIRNVFYYLWKQISIFYPCERNE